MAGSGDYPSAYHKGITRLRTSVHSTVINDYAALWMDSKLLQSLRYVTRSVAAVTAVTVLWFSSR